jgi:hypothetical protein
MIWFLCLMTMTSMQTQLGSHVDAWNRIGASSNVIDWVVNCVPIQFNTVPNHTWLPNPKFSAVHRTFIRSEVKRLLEIDAIEECVHKPYFVSPINVVPKKQNKFRLITNLKVLNTHIFVKTFRNEDIRTLMELVQHGDEMISVNLKDCFFSF